MYLLFCLCAIVTVIFGGYSGGVPPLPIPNREVKPACADGTAMQCGRVGSRLFSSGVLRQRCPGTPFFVAVTGVLSPVPLARTLCFFFFFFFLVLFLSILHSSFFILYSSFFIPHSSFFILHSSSPYSKDMMIHPYFCFFINVKKRCCILLFVLLNCCIFV